MSTLVIINRQHICALNRSVVKFPTFCGPNTYPDDSGNGGASAGNNRLATIKQCDPVGHSDRFRQLPGKHR